MSRRVPLNVRFRPQPVVTAEVERSARAANRLLAEPADWLCRLHRARVDVELDAPEGHRHEGLEAAGFRPLCTAWFRHPGWDGRIERRAEVWVDRTTSIRAEVIGDRQRRVYLSTLFEDGSSLVSIPDEAVAEWVRSPTCAVLCGSGDVRADLTLFRRRAAQGRPLLCANGDAYRRHLDLMVLRQSKQPVGAGRADGRLIFPMTWLLAAELIMRRDLVADAAGLPDLRADA